MSCKGYQGRNPTNCKPDGGSDEIRIRAGDGFAREFTQPLLIHAVGAARKHQDRFAGILPLEYQRFGDLAKRAPGSIRCLLRGSCALCELNHLAREAADGQEVLDALCGGR